MAARFLCAFLRIEILFGWGRMRQLFSRHEFSDDLRSALRRFESGLYEQAGQQVLAILQKNPGDQDALYLLRLVERRLARPKPLPAPTLIWQFNPDGAWESEWLRTLLSGSIGKETIDNTWSQRAETMIVVDNRLVDAKAPYYRSAFEAGCRIILVHLSDEAFKDDYGIYRYCDAVIRNYHSELLADFARIAFIPLGYKAGFTRTNSAPKPASARQYLWSFAGDAKKLTRGPMLETMQKLGNGVQHLTNGFGTDDALSIGDYRTLMDESVLIPCPGGWSNLETFRVYEALEAGCIPIVEKRPGFDYFTTLLGPHPLPTFTSWSEAADKIAAWKADGALEALRLRCSAWWQDYKPALKHRISGFVADALKG
jgi:hypothetical protein